jgi:alkylation response protein AidB-like acyl-CoA dehydrogenase
MDFDIPEELVALRASFATFLEREVRPLEDDVAPRYWRGETDSPEQREAAGRVKRRSAQEGFYAAHLPESVGGWGLSNVGMTLLVEDAARSGMRLAAHALAPPNPEGPTPLLLDLPTHLQDVYLKPLVTGEATMCFALTEPEAGSDAQAIRTRAERDGDEWVLNGTKHYITNGDRADFAVVFAVTDPAKRAAGGITAFVVPGGAYEVGKVQHTIADTHPVELRFIDSRVPADHVLGEVGLGFHSAMRFLNAGRAYIGAQCLGTAEWCLEQAVAHARVRTTFGRPIAQYQGVSFPLAESKADIEAMRWLIYRLAWIVDRGDDAMVDSSIVKFFATERAYQVADRCLQVFGGQGLLKEGPIEGALRTLRMLRVVEGATEIQKLVIARSMGL